MSDYLLSFDPGIINMAYCLVEIETLEIINWGKFSIKDSTNEGCAKKLVDHLNRLNLTDDINSIVIHEQQPRCNIKTITICGQLQMYYVIEKMNKDTNGHIEKIVGHHAKHKINYYQAGPDDEPMPWERLNNLKKGHYRTKQILIEHCRRILKQHNQLDWLEWFEQQKKRDDISDAYVMGLSYIKMNKLGPFKKL